MIQLILTLLISSAPASTGIGYFYFSGVKPGVEPVFDVLIRQHDCRLLAAGDGDVRIAECPSDTVLPAIPSVYQWRVTVDLPLPYPNGRTAVVALVQSENLHERMSALRYLSLHPRAWRLRQSTPEFASSISAAHAVLKDWRHAASVIEGAGGGPMQDMFAEIVSGMERVGHPFTDRLVLLQAAVPARLDHLRRWLGWWSARVGDVERLPESAPWEMLQPGEWRGIDFPNTKFTQLGLRARTFDVGQRTASHALDLYLSDEDPSWALAVLGLAETAEAAKADILNFISAKDEVVSRNLGKFERSYQFAEFTRRAQIKSDRLDLAKRFFLSAIEAEDLSEQKPQVWREWETVRQSIFRDASFNGPFIGHHLMHRLIVSLRKPKTEFADVPEFSPKIYAASVYDILTALIAERRDRLHTRGAYLAVLDTAVGWQKYLRADANGRAVLRSRGMRARDEALSAAIREALIEPLPRLPRAACEILLSP